MPQAEKMAHLIESPTDEEFEWSQRWMIGGGIASAIAVITFIVLFVRSDGPLTGVPSKIAGGAAFVLVYGLAAISWGLRIPAREHEYRLASRTGMTPAYSMGCVSIAIILALTPFLIIASSQGWIGPKH